MSREFILFDKAVDWWKNSDLIQFYCKYSRQSFNKDLFHIYNLEYPLSMVDASEKRKSEFLAGRYCARQALSSFGVEAFQVRIGDNRSPLWPEGYCGSISHTGDVATAVVGNNANILGVGVDVERVLAHDFFEDVKTHVLTPGEYYLLNSRKYSKYEMLTIIFSLKESFFKAAYNLTQCYFGFEAITIIAIDSESGTVTFCINETLHERLCRDDILQGQFIFAEEDLVATLVTLYVSSNQVYSSLHRMAG